MKKILLLTAFTVCSFAIQAQIDIIPKPLSVEVSADSATVSFTAVKDKIKQTLANNIPGISSKEGYRLTIGNNGVEIAALAPAGLYYGSVTLNQMAENGAELPVCTITDEPRFKYRGVMLDISRHFRDKDFIKKQIDIMAKLKLNNLHLHLTDAAGWRLEIKRYPELTEKAAWRKGDTWKEWNKLGNRYSSKADSEAYGGYLTQDDAREIVEYAASHHINVIPEIEMPSHSNEATAAYPILSCNHDANGQSDFCIGSEETFTFIEDVLDEVMEIFPSHIIHVGGDEANKQAWKDCELCKKRMEEHSLENVDQLQSYLIGRVEKYLNSKGRELLGWDEIMDGGLTPNAIVMSWRGTESGIKAAMGGHDAIMAPGGYCYLDGYQDAPQSQPEAIGGYLPLKRVYSYNPVPDSLSARLAQHIIGIQGNLWCEFIPTAEHAEYMLYPRVFAIAETGWTADSLKDYSDFHSRALKLSAEMKRAGYNVFDLQHEIGNKPEALRREKHLAVGKPVTYNIPWWSRYPASGTATLTDGIRGGWNYSDLLWQGFLYQGDNRMDVTIDLEKVQRIKSIGIEFMQLIGPGVWFPSSVTFQVSKKGKDFTTLETINHEQVPSEGVSFKNYQWKGKSSARYVRVIAKAKEGCQFADEIIVK